MGWVLRSIGGISVAYISCALSAGGVVSPAAFYLQLVTDRVEGLALQVLLGYSPGSEDVRKVYDRYLKILYAGGHKEAAIKAQAAKQWVIPLALPDRSKARGITASQKIFDTSWGWDDLEPYIPYAFRSALHNVYIPVALLKEEKKKFLDKLAQIRTVHEVDQHVKEECDHLLAECARLEIRFNLAAEIEQRKHEGASLEVPGAEDYLVSNMRAVDADVVHKGVEGLIDYARLDEALRNFKVDETHLKDKDWFGLVADYDTQWKSVEEPWLKALNAISALIPCVLPSLEEMPTRNEAFKIGDAAWKKVKEKFAYKIDH